MDDGTILNFGIPLTVLETLLSTAALDDSSPVARKSIDLVIKMKSYDLEFDTGLLKGITMKESYRFVDPPAPYPEEWKNFPVIGSEKIFSGMHRDQFVSYLDAWEKRAKALGAEKVSFGDLNRSQYAISEDDDFVHMVHVAMGASRRAGGGGIWCDGWTATFTRDKDHIAGVAEGTLTNLSAFRDEFNTVARPK